MKFQFLYLGLLTSALASGAFLACSDSSSTTAINAQNDASPEKTQDSSVPTGNDAGAPDDDASVDPDSGIVPITDAGVDTGLSFATSIYAPIIETHCVFCHNVVDGGPGSGAQFGRLDMTTAATAYANLVGDGGGAAANGFSCAALGANGLLRVAPGAPEESLFYNKVWSNQGDGGTSTLADGGPAVFCGHPMPLGEPSIPAAEIATIHDWIAQGAKP